MLRSLGDGFTDMFGGVSFSAAPDVSGDPLTQGETYVQWAEATLTSSADWPTKYGQTSYNLGQFWTLKTANYATDPGDWDLLDMRAQQALASLGDMGLVSDNPPAQQKYADLTRGAYAQAATIAANVDPTMVKVYQDRAGLSAGWLQTAKTQGVNDTLKASVIDAAKNVIPNALGVPTWAFVAGAIGLLWFLYGRR